MERARVSNFTFYFVFDSEELNRGYVEGGAMEITC